MGRGGVGWQHACAMQTNMVPLNFFSIVAPMVVEMRTTRCHKFIQVSVITMLLGEIGCEAGGTFARHRSDFRSACMGSFTDSSKTFFHEQAYTEYLYVQVISTIARGKSREYRQGD